MATLDSTNKTPQGRRRTWTNAGAPSSGAAGTLYNRAEPGDLLIDTTNKTLYQNTNTQASPTWTERAASGAALGVVGDMAAAGTGTANSVGSGTTAASIDHVHALGTHDHSGSTKGGAIVLAAMGADIFTADADGRGKFQTGLFDAATLTDLVAADAFTNAVCDAAFIASAFAADADSRLIFQDGIWTAAKLADDCLSADATGRAKIQTDFFDAATLDDTVADDAITNAVADAKFAASAFAADADSRAIFADGIWQAAKMATGLLSADATGRALVATAFFDAATCALVFDDNSIPSGKVNWSYGAVGLIEAITPDDSASAGTDAGVARVDHQHAVTCAAPADGSLAAANAEGAATNFSRSDHAHRALVLDAVEMEFGTGYDAVIGWEQGDADNHTLVIGLADANQALHIADKTAIATDWDVAANTHPSVYIHSDTTPATDYLKLWHDATSGYVNVAGGTLALQIAGTTEALLTATELALTSGTDLKFLGDDGIVDSAGNEVIMVEAVGSAINYLNVKNAATGNPIVLECLGTADKGFIFANDQDEELLTLTPVASATVDLTILNAATGAQPIIRVTGEADLGLEIQNAAGEVELETVSTAAPLNWLSISNANTAVAPIVMSAGEDDIGISFCAKNAEQILDLAAVAAAINFVKITSSATGNAPAIAAAGDNDNIDLSLAGKGTGYVRMDTIVDMSDNVLYGSVAANGNLILSSSFHGTKGFVGIATGEQGFKLGGTADRAGTVGDNGLDIFNGAAAPAGTLANGITLYSEGGECKVLDAAGNSTTLSPHTEDGDYIIHSYSAAKDETVTIHLEKLLKAIATGELAKYVEVNEGHLKKAKAPK